MIHALRAAKEDKDDAGGEDDAGGDGGAEVLYCIVVDCTVVYCSVLYCNVFYCKVLYGIVLCTLDYVLGVFLLFLPPPELEFKSHYCWLNLQHQ